MGLGEGELLHLGDFPAVGSGKGQMARVGLESLE